MKGIVFTEFLEMVEDRFTAATADRMLEAVALPSGGVYTSVGTYDSAEMVSLVKALSALVSVPVPDLLKAFGQHLFGQFVQKFPGFFIGIDGPETFLARVDGLVHVEVRKLYPDAELPTFACEGGGPVPFAMTYRSPRNFPDLAEGLIVGCYSHFGQHVVIRREEAVGTPPAIRFVMSSPEPA